MDVGYRASHDFAPPNLARVAAREEGMVGSVALDTDCKAAPRGVGDSKVNAEGAAVARQHRREAHLSNGASYRTLETI